MPDTTEAEKVATEIVMLLFDLTYFDDQINRDGIRTRVDLIRPIIQRLLDEQHAQKIAMANFRPRKPAPKQFESLPGQMTFPLTNSS